MRRFFPLAFFGKSLKSVVLSSLFHTLIAIAFEIASFLLAFLFPSMPDALSIAINIICQIVLLYCVAGIAVSVLYASGCFEKK